VILVNRWVKSAPRRLQIWTALLFAVKNPEAVMLDLVQPAGSGGRAGDQRKLARADEADYRIASQWGRAPGYVHGVIGM
jgi:hypothetical protein